MACKCSSTIIAVVLAIFGVVFFVAGCVLWFGGVFENIIDDKVNQNVELKSGTLVYKQWKDPTSPIYMQYFVFNIENPAEIIKGAKPNVTQIGPYSYREIRTNDVLNFSADGTVVTFMPNRSYVFDPETSCNGCNPLTDNFTTVNIPLLTLAMWLRDTNYHKYLFCSGVLAGAMIYYTQTKGPISLFQSRTVHEILWGYVDPLLTFIIKEQAKFPIKCPLKPGLNTFIQLQYNNTYYGISAINTGLKDIDKLEQYTMWRDEKHLSWWESNYTNMINGTDGTQFKPRVTKTDKLYVFVPEICRSIYAVYDSTITVRGIKLYRFTAPNEVYLSGDIYPPNKGFCVPRDKCLPTGLLNVTRCQPQNPPVVISPPQFYQSNHSLVEAINGLHPVKSEHGTFIDVEPITGITMQANKRIQVNIALEPVNTTIYTMGKFERIFMPVMYVNESAKISEDDANTFKKQVYDPIDLTKGVEYGLIALGGLLILIATIVFLVGATRKRKGFQKLENEEERTPVNT